METGKFIVIYGVNNLGKTTQAKILVDKLNSVGRKAKYLKYPIYDLEPSGPALNKYLRGGNPEKLTAKDAQALYAQNRKDYGATRKADLEAGFDIVAEDYWGTGVAWGMGAGVDKDYLLEINTEFIGKEDLALLFVGKRFESGFEKNHLHEQDDEFVGRVDMAHRKLSQEFGWKTIDASGRIEEVSERVWREVEKVIPA